MRVIRYLRAIWATLVAFVLGYSRGVRRALRSLSGSQAFYVVTHPRLAVKFSHAIAGADPHADRLADAEAAVRSAVEAMETANRSIDDAGEDADVDELRQAFDQAERTYQDAQSTLRRLKSVGEARANMPTEPAEEERGGEGGEGEGEARVTNEPATYERGGEHSFFGDMAAATLKHDRAAQDRLDAHRREVEAEGRALSTTANAGGQFVPPTWMNNEFIALARAGRPTANLVRNLQLPPGANSINIPSVSTGGATAAQADNGSVQSTDPATSSIAVPVKTIAGQVDTSRQLVDRAQPGIDQVIFGDLVADYGTKLDVQVLNGSGSGANATGILQTSNIEAVTYTDASPTVAELFPKLADAIQRVPTNRFMPAEAIIMHPRRWGWLNAAVDSASRPLVVPNPNAFNPIGVSQHAEGTDMSSMSGAPVPVGTLLGLPVYLDPSIPTNLGGSTNEDIIIVARVSDLYLWEEGEPNQATYFEVLSGSLGVRFQVYGYFAFTAARYPTSIATVGGTGLATPSF